MSNKTHDVWAPASCHPTTALSGRGNRDRGSFLLAETGTGGAEHQGISVTGPQAVPFSAPFLSWDPAEKIQVKPSSERAVVGLTMGVGGFSCPDPVTWTEVLLPYPQVGGTHIVNNVRFISMLKVQPLVSRATYLSLEPRRGRSRNRNVSNCREDHTKWKPHFHSGNPRFRSFC